MTKAAPPPSTFITSPTIFVYIQPRLITFYYTQFQFSKSTVLFHFALRLGLPLVLAKFIQYFDPASTASVAEGWLLAIAVIAMSSGIVLVMHYHMLCTQRIGMRCRVACCSLMYRKVPITLPLCFFALSVLSTASSAEQDVGQPNASRPSRQPPLQRRGQVRHSSDFLALRLDNADPGCDSHCGDV